MFSSVPLAAAGGSPPTILSVTYAKRLLTVKIAGYNHSDTYGVELSRYPDRASDGHFVTRRNAGLVPLAPDNTGTWYLRRLLAPGRWYVRAYADYTGSVLAARDTICQLAGCQATWTGVPYLAWSSTFLVTVG